MKLNVLILAVCTLISCGSKSTSDTKNHTSNFSALEYINSYYKLENNHLEFVRILKDASRIYKIRGFITYDIYYNKKITNKQIIKETEVDFIYDNYKTRGFKDYLYKKDDVLFVQLQIKNKGYFEVLDLRHELEDKIDKALTKRGQGSWFAGDDGNMLFEVKESTEGFKIILDELNSADLNNEFVIAKRLYLADDNWKYEIIYPITYNGKINII